MFSSLDRWYFCIPSWILKNLCTHASLLVDPLRCAREGVSDHAPTGVLFAPCVSIPDSMRPISPSICKDPYFRFILDKMVANSGLRALHGDRRLRMHKEILREAANKTRQHKMTYDDSDFTRDSILNTLARVVSKQHSKLAAFLIEKNKLAKEHLRLSNGKVCSEILLDSRIRFVNLGLVLFRL